MRDISERDAWESLPTGHHARVSIRPSDADAGSFDLGEVRFLPKLDMGFLRVPLRCFFRDVCSFYPFVGGFKGNLKRKTHVILNLALQTKHSDQEKEESLLASQPRDITNSQIKGTGHLFIPHPSSSHLVSVFMVRALRKDTPLNRPP